MFERGFGRRDASRGGVCRLTSPTSSDALDCRPLTRWRRPRKSRPPRPPRHTAFVVITWFALNMTIANLNKWIFHRYPFKYPAALTMCHMVTSYVMSDATLRVRGQIAKKLSSKTKFAVTQLSLVFVVSVAAGNAALGYIHVSFAQAIGATAPLWTVLLSVLLTRKSYPPLVYAALGLISVGMLLTVRGEVNFHAIGFALVLTATLTRALKSILQGLLLSSPEERLDPIELLYHMAYRSAIALGLYALVMERGLLSDPNVREPMLWLCVPPRRSSRSRFPRNSS